MEYAIEILKEQQGLLFEELRFLEGEEFEENKRRLDDIENALSNIESSEHYELLLHCCNSIISSIDNGNVPRKGINGLRILLNRQ